MRISQTIKTRYFVVLFMLVMLLPVNTFSAVQKADNWLDEPVYIRFQDEPLSKVLEKVSKQTGIAILYDQELANERVTGNYKGVKASDAITRLFSSKNKSIQVSKDKKVIVVKTFGAKNFIWAGSAQGMQSKDHESGPMTLADLKKMHAQQYKAYKERIANENEIIEGGENPMTRGEIWAMHEQQSKAYKERVANDNEIIEGGENPMTRGENRAMHEQQYKAYRERIASDNEIIEGGEDGKGMTRGVIRAMHEKQYKDYKERQKDRTRVVN